MKRFIKMLAVTCVAALALTAMAAAGASAATFTASATGTLTAAQTTTHQFTTGSGTVSCKKAHTEGTITSTAAASQHVTVKYSECTAYGFPATVSSATYELYAGGTVDVENTITVSVPFLGCKLTVSPQNGLGSASYTNKSGKIEQHTAVTGIVSKGEGSCGGGTNGAYHGSSLVERVGGGTLEWDA
ncbi:MAG TPA: hypothetical protein VFZ19_01285 [Solirubrobacterales bacterium]